MHIAQHSHDELNTQARFDVFIDVLMCFFVLIGCCYMKPLLVPGGRAFVWPTVQRVQRISLNTMTLQIDSPCVYTSQGVPISVTGIAQVCICDGVKQIAMNVN